MHKTYSQLREIKAHLSQYPIVSVYAPEVYFRVYLQETLKQAGMEWVAVSPSDLQWDQLCQQNSLFEEVKALRFENIQPQLLTEICQFSKTHSLHPILVFADKKKLTPSLQSTVEAVGGICLEEPLYFNKEMHLIVGDMALLLGLNLSKPALEFLVQLDVPLIYLFNELRKLQLILTSGEEVQVAHLSQYCYFLANSNIFSIENLLLRGRYAPLQTRVSELLLNGEPALTILGVIVKHCRLVLKLIGLRAQKVSKAEIRKQIYIPYRLEESYYKIAHEMNVKRYKKVLELCQQIDFAIKSSKVSQEHLFGELCFALSKQ